MIVTGISFQQFESIITTLNKSKYASNPIVIENERVFSNNRFSVKLGSSISKAAGSRRSGSGRHGKYLSWGGFYDVMTGIFRHNSDAAIRSSAYKFIGETDFYHQTDYNMGPNVGSMFAPSYMEDNGIDLEFDARHFDWDKLTW